MPRSSSASTARAILWGGGIAGALDLAFALVFFGAHGATPMGVLQSISGGLVGRQAAYSGGTATAALGVGLHFVIALGAAAVFCLAARRWPWLVRRAWLAGCLYGAVVWWVMNQVVVPLSALRPVPFPPRHWVEVLAAHVILIGPPIALAAKRFGRAGSASAPGGG